MTVTVIGGYLRLERTAILISAFDISTPWPQPWNEPWKQPLPQDSGCYTIEPYSRLIYSPRLKH